MNRIILILTISAGSSIGWTCGTWGGIMGAYMTSVVGAALGLYLGKKFIRNYLDGD